MSKAPKIELPGSLDDTYVIPDGTTQAQLDAMIAQVQADAQKLLADDNASAEDVAKAQWFISVRDAVLKPRVGELVAEAEQHQAQIEAARAALGNAEDDGDDAAGDEGDGTEGGDGAEDEHRDGDKPAGDGSAAPDASQQSAPEPVLVASAAAARRRSAIADAASGNGGKPVVQPPIKVRAATLVAAANVPGHVGGATLTKPQMGSLMSRQFEQLPDTPGGGRQVMPLGQFHMDVDPELVAAAAPGKQRAELDAAIEWALSGERLKRETGGDTLLAAGGWCAPSETLYDLLDLTTADGLLDIASIVVNRGGVRFSVGPDFGAVYSAGANFTKTEAQAIAGSTKPVVNIPCPTFTDNRMSVDGMYFTGDILSAKGYPEGYADFLTKAGKAFQHYVNAKTIAAMVTGSTAVDLKQAASTPPFFESGSAATELLGAVELQIVDMQYRNRLSLSNLAVELVLPLFARGIIRSDLARRMGIDDPANIPNSAIDNFFTERGASVQFVYDWQDFFADGAGMGASTPAVAWPATLKFLIYPQGTFVRALSDVIDLSAIYDSTLLATNQYVALFMEQARLVLKRGWDARVCDVRVQITGASGAAIDYTTKQPTV